MIRRPRADVRSPTDATSEGSIPAPSWRLTLLLTFALLCPLPSLAAEGEPGAPKGGEDVGPPWFTVDSGGATSSAGGLTLVATIGQPELGVSEDLLNGLVLVGGFWGVGPAPVSLFADGFESGNTAQWSAVLP